MAFLESFWRRKKPMANSNENISIFFGGTRSVKKLPYREFAVK